MRIKLIAPQMSLRPMDSEYKRRMSPSLSLLTIAALTPPEHTVTIADENTGLLSRNDTPDLVGITVNVDTSSRAYAISRRYQALGIPVILGGIHVSANPDEALQHADAVCIGEAEPVWGRVLADVQAGCLQSRYSTEVPIDAGRIPEPRWDLLDTRRYLYTNIVCATRGCPYKCAFCYNSCDYVHHTHRARPVEHVIREIERLGTKQVMFIDDNLIGNIGYAWELVRALDSLGVCWHAAVSANIGEHLDLLDAMRASGCKSLFIGFESINGNALQSARKHQNHTIRYERTIREIHRRGMMVDASLVFGFDEDGPDVFDWTLEWLVVNKIETMTAHILTPYPGTRLYKRMLAEDRIDDFDWSHYNTAHVVFRPKHMSKDELYAGYLRMYDEFYSFKNILKRMPEQAAVRIPYFLFNFGYRKFGKFTSKVAGSGGMNVIGRVARRLSYGIG